MASFDDYYEILQVHHSAESEVIDAAFKRLAKKYHPDLNKDPAASEKMKKINKAYETLSDPEKRKQYHQNWLRVLGTTASQTKGSASLEPEPAVDPKYILFNGLHPGQVRTASFIIRNIGGPYTKISISNPDSWLKIVRWFSLVDSDELPLKAEIEAEGQTWGTNLLEYITVRLVNEDAETSGETQVKVELRIEPEPVTGKYGVGSIPSNRPSYTHPLRRTSKLSGKNWALALFFSWSMGALGVDRFYLGDVTRGFAKIAVTIASVTLAHVTDLFLFYLPYLAWWIVDIILVVTRKI